MANKVLEMAIAINYKLYRKRLVMLAIGTQQLQLSKS